jgi:hypothetical protein
MDDSCPHTAHDHLLSAPAHCPERRKHPRMECIAWQGTVPTPGLEQPGSARPTPFRKLLVRLRLAARPADPLPYGARIVAERDRRLPAIADRLEAILDELDQLEAWREASDVCSAIERLRARSAEG